MTRQWLEIISLLLNVWCVYLVIKKKTVNWIIGIISILPLIYIFYEVKLYGQVVVQFAYLIQSVYGYMEWEKNEHNKKIKVEKFDIHKDFDAFIILTFVCLPFLVIKMSFLDYMLFYMSIIAMWMLTKRLIENWIIYMIIDVLSVILFIKEKIYITAGLYFIFFIMAIIGYVQWNRSIKEKA